eukprot:95929_1
MHMGSKFLLVPDCLTDRMNTRRLHELNYINKIEQSVKSDNLICCENKLISSWTYNSKDGDNVLVLKHCTNLNNLLRIYQKTLTGIDTICLFINMNEQKNYSLSVLKKWNKIKTNSTNYKNPMNKYKSYQLLQRLMIGMAHFIYPVTKYIVIILCSNNQLIDKYDEKKTLITQCNGVQLSQCDTYSHCLFNYNLNAYQIRN